MGFICMKFNKTTHSISNEQEPIFDELCGKNMY